MNITLQLYFNIISLSPDIHESQIFYIGRCPDKIAGSTHDLNYEEISSIDEQRLFDDNGISRIVEHLPYYPVDESFKFDWHLYRNRYNEWNIACEYQSGLSKVDMVNLIKDSIAVVHHQRTLMVMTIVQVLVLKSLIFIFSSYSVAFSWNSFTCACYALEVINGKYIWKFKHHIARKESKSYHF